MEVHKDLIISLRKGFEQKFCKKDDKEAQFCK